MTTTTQHEFDAVIVGAGPAGCAAAAVLAQHGRKVTPLERRARDLVSDDAGRVTGVRAVEAEGDTLELHAPITIGPTGRDTFAQSCLAWRAPDEKLKKMAIWTDFKGAKSSEGLDEGTTMVVYLPQKGWFWFIPLPNGVVSVGCVADKDHLFDGSKDLGEIFMREVAKQPWMSERLAPGTRIDEFRVTSELSYRSRHCAKDGLVLIGDAFAFLDPVFS